MPDNLLVPLSDLIELRYGKALPERDRINGPFAVYGSNGIVGRHNKFFLDKQTIIVGRKGSVGEITLTENHSWSIDTTYYVEMKTDNKLDMKYLYYFLKTLNLKSFNTSSAVPGLNRKYVLELSIPLPDIDKQREIATILQQVSSLIKRREQANLMVNRILQAVFLQMFGDPATNSKRWQINTLESVCSEIVDCPHSSPVCADSGIPLIRTPNIKKGYIDFEETRYVSEEEHKKRLRRICPAIGDILYAREATFGNAGLVNSNQEFSIGQRIMLLRPNASIIKSEFLVWIINSDYVYNQAKQVARGSTNPHVNVADVRKFKIVVPPIDLQDKFVLILRKAEQIKSIQNKSTKNVDTLFDSLMSKAFRGELAR